MSWELYRSTMERHAIKTDDMATEDAILQALGAVRSFALEGEKLILNNADGKELMELKKKP